MPRPRPIPAQLLDRPFPTTLADRHNVTRTMLEGRRFRRLFSGVHVCADVELDLVVWLQAAFVVLPDDVLVTSVTGLHARGVLVGRPWPLRLVSMHAHPVRRRGLRVTRVAALPPHAGRFATAEHCFVSACAELDLVDAVTAGDWLVRLGRTTPRELALHAAGWAGRGGSLARRAAAYVRERVESPRETVLRLLLVLTGLPEPECNVDIRAGAGFVGRGDLVYALQRVVVEYDGRQHAENPEQWERDLDRLDDFEALRWSHVRVTNSRLRRPRDVVCRVYDRLVARGFTGPAPVFGAEWVALFEKRSSAQRAREAPDPESWSTDCAP